MRLKTIKEISKLTGWSKYKLYRLIKKMNICTHWDKGKMLLDIKDLSKYIKETKEVKVIDLTPKFKEALLFCEKAKKLSMKDLELIMKFSGMKVTMRKPDNRIDIVTDDKVWDIP